MAHVTVEELTREEKLLLATALDVETEENTGSGHNTEWGNTVDLVLEGRKGLLDFTDDELDEHLEYFFEELSPELNTKYELLLWARRLSRIDRIDSAGRKWEPVEPGIQEVWDAEDRKMRELGDGTQED